MTRKKYIVFALLTIALVVFASVVVLLALDLYAHRKFSQVAGLNHWGYRGPVAGRKQRGEQRVVVLGESTAFGYGVAPRDSFPAILQELLNQRNSASGKRVSVVNLAYNNEGAHSYRFTLEDYAYLKYDAVVFYSGYNDLSLNLAVYRHTSPVFRAIGYMPILPLVLREKAMTITHGGRLEDAYLGKKPVFKPNVAQSAAAGAIAALADGMNALNRPLNSEGAGPDPIALQEGAACGPTWAHYCGGMYRAVKIALDGQKKVMIVTQPKLLSDLVDHLDQQKRLAAFLQQRFPGNRLLSFTNLSEAVNVGDPALSYDAMHLTAAGNRVIARELLVPVSEMLR
jgi:lysophospholipase L1-like esterase